MYAVGYGKPPTEYRFKKGISGNPNGRRRMNIAPKVNATSTDLDAVILGEAERTIKLRENDIEIELPMIQAVMRSLGVAAVKGNHKAQLAYTGIVQAAQIRKETLRLQVLDAALEYKEEWTSHLRQYDGSPDKPNPIPHPDDIFVDIIRG